MKRQILFWITLLGAIGMTAFPASAQYVNYQQGTDYSQYITPDRYLNVEVWTNNNDYYQGDGIHVSFRANRDAYVAIYDIDTRGQVNLIYPSDPQDNGFVEGGRTYTIPGSRDNYELTVQGPSGTEYLQIVGSQEPMGIPDWFRGSGLVAQGDPNDFLNYIAATYFGCDDCPRAVATTTFGVREWHNYYFRPVYAYPYGYPDWDFSGSVFIDYPFGASIYIDGIYWGCAPLFIPRIYYGYHYITIFDRHGYCWEDRFDVVRYRAVIFDQDVVHFRPGVRSRYRDVQSRGYLDPVKHGYPDYVREARIKETTYKPISNTIIDKSVRSQIGDRYKGKPVYVDQNQIWKQDRSLEGRKAIRETRPTSDRFQKQQIGQQPGRTTRPATTGEKQQQPNINRDYYNRGSKNAQNPNSGQQKAVTPTNRQPQRTRENPQAKGTNQRPQSQGTKERQQPRNTNEKAQPQDKNDEGRSRDMRSYYNNERSAGERPAVQANRQYNSSTYRNSSRNARQYYNSSPRNSQQQRMTQQSRPQAQRTYNQQPRQQVQQRSSEQPRVSSTPSKQAPQSQPSQGHQRDERGRR